MQMVIIEYPVVYPFVRSAVTVGLLIFLRSPRDRGIESDVPVRLGVDTAVIGGEGEHVSLQGQDPILPQVRGQRHLRECFCLQYPQLTIR